MPTAPRYPLIDAAVKAAIASAQYANKYEAWLRALAAQGLVS